MQPLTNMTAAPAKHPLEMDGAGGLNQAMRPVAIRFRMSLSTKAIRLRRGLPARRPGSALFLKLVDPEEREGERFEVYEEGLRRLRA